MEKTLEIRIIAKQQKAGNGREFTTYKAVQKGGALIDCKFTKACKNVPDKSCTIRVFAGDVNVDNNRLYPVLWVKNVLEIVLPDGSAGVSKNEEMLLEMFG